MIKTKDGFVPAEKAKDGYKAISGAKLAYTKKGIEVVKEGASTTKTHAKKATQATADKVKRTVKKVLPKRGAKK